MTDMTSLIGSTINRPQGRRVPMNVDEKTRAAVRDLLFQPWMRGVGYSEFLERAVDRAYEEAGQMRPT